MRAVIATPLSWKYGFPCESLTPFSISCIVIVERALPPTLSLVWLPPVRMEVMLLFLFSTTTLYKSMLVGFNVITFRY